MAVKLVVIGSLLMLLGMTMVPFMVRFWHPGFFGRPEPTGWAGFLNRIAGGVFLLSLLTRAAFKVPSDLLFIALGALLLAYGVFSWLALPLPLVVLSTGLTGLVICSTYLLSRSPSLRFALAQMLLGGRASFISALRGLPDQTPPLALYRDLEFQAVTALHWLPADAGEGPERLIATEGTHLHFWHPQRGSRRPFSRPPQELPGFAPAVITGLAVSPDNRYLATADREGHITFYQSIVSGTPPQRSIHWQTLLNLSVAQADLELRHPGVHHLESVNALTWAPTLPYQLAFGANDHTVKVWFIGQVLTELPERRPAPTAPMARQHLVHVYRQQQPITAVAWSPDGERIASASADATVHIWQVATGETVRIFRGHQEAIQALAWSPNGERLASASADGIVYVWQALTGETIATYQGQKGSALPVAWSPDGQWLAWAGQQNTVQVLKASTEHISATYRKHTKPVLAISWSSDGHQIASGGEDRTVQVWKVPDQE